MRPRLMSDREAKAELARLSNRLGRKPTVRQYAAAVGISTRTAFRYLSRVSTHACCPRCQGTGWIRVGNR